AGEDFPLSIDLRVQGVVENELAIAAEEHKVKGAVAVVADVQTGEILAMASWPTYDANRRNAGLQDATRHRVVSARYDVGAVVQSWTVPAGLDTGRADMNALFDAYHALEVGKRRLAARRATGKGLTLEEVYLHSANRGSSRLA